ncbi:MAG: tRNA-(ms[2]io[6]A)-hydroxylase [Myxococcota bacterium]
MLNLAAPTTSSWTTMALAHLDEVLVDHAHCEQKAAGSAVQLMFRYPDHLFLLEPLSRLAREELAHFEAMLRLLADRGIPFRRQRPAPYAGRLHGFTRTVEPERLIDTLLCCALIEARSCERFQLLAEAVADPDLAGFYKDLLADEARHHRVFVDLAVRLGPEASIRARLRQLAERESAILAEPPSLPRMHA